MKALKTTVIAVGLIVWLVACEDITAPQLKRITKAAFNLGVCYGETAKNDLRYKYCKTYEDLAELAWKIYQEENINISASKKIIMPGETITITAKIPISN